MEIEEIRAPDTRPAYEESHFSMTALDCVVVDVVVLAPATSCVDGEAERRCSTAEVPMAVNRGGPGTSHAQISIYQ
jgi:hypothetical protein